MDKFPKTGFVTLPAMAVGAGPPRHLRDLRETREPGERSLDLPVLKFCLAEETEALHHEEGWRNTGHNAKTLVKHHDFSIVLITMKKGNRMKEHRTEGAISIQGISGRLRLHVGKIAIEVSTGSLVALDRAVAHDVEALEDSAFVLSVCTEAS